MTKQERQVRLLKWSDAYYNKSESLVPDHEYDAEYDSYKNDYPNDPFLKTVGSPIDPASEWEKATHKIPMKSLNKVVIEDEFKSWATKNNIPIFCISEKLDGISIDLEYDNGNLVKAITRGDGEIGEDITKNVKRMQGVKETLENFTGSLRGEIILKQNDFESIVAIQSERNENPIKNLRNGASGLAKRYDGKYSEYLSIVYFDITGEYGTKYAKFLAIERLGLPTALVQLYYSIEQVVELYEKYEQGRRASLNYEIDGLVLETNDIDHFNELGEVNERPRGAVAFKFTSIKKETKILGVTWQLGKSGTITPVAELEPVEMGGVTVKRASLHNLELFKSMNLHINDTVLVSRRNDVIPYVESVVSRSDGFSVPVIQTCPVCDTQVIESGKFLECPNPDCAGAMIGTIMKWLDVTGMKSQGIGEKTIEKLFQLGAIQVPSDLYELIVSDFDDIPGFGTRSAEKIVGIIQSHKDVTLSQMIGGVNMKNFSTSMAELLVENGIDTLDKMRMASAEQLVAIKGIEIITAENFIYGLKDKNTIIDELIYVGVKIIEKSSSSGNDGKLKDMTFCFTGAVQAVDENGERYKRSMLESLVKENGGTVKSVSSGLMYLVQADPNSESSKTIKARGLGVEIISDIKFLEMIK